MIVNVRAGPVQLLAVGVTLMVAITGDVAALVTVKELIFPEPFAPSPTDVVLLVHA